MSRPRCISPTILAPLALLIGALCAVLPSTGCAGPAHTEAGLPQARPGDFTLGVTVFGPSSGVRERGQVPARYIVTPDGWLRTAVGPGARESVYPQRTRLLDARQRDELWAMVRATGIQAAKAPMRLESPESFDPPAGRRIYLVQLTAAEHRVSVAAPSGEPESAPYAELAARLAEWSWVEP